MGVHTDLSQMLFNEYASANYDEIRLKLSLITLENWMRDPDLTTAT